MVLKCDAVFRFSPSTSTSMVQSKCQDTHNNYNDLTSILRHFGSFLNVLFWANPSKHCYHHCFISQINSFRIWKVRADESKHTEKKILELKSHFLTKQGKSGPNRKCFGTTNRFAMKKKKKKCSAHGRLTY